MSNKREDYIYPTVDLLQKYDFTQTRQNNIADIQAIIPVIEKIFCDLGVSVKTQNYIIGNLFSRIELQVLSDTPFAKIARMRDELIYSLGRNVKSVIRLLDKNSIAVEIQNKERELIPLKEAVEASLQREGKIVLGFDISREPYFCDLSSLSHTLIGGTTGSGKSIFLNAILLSLLYKYSPSELNLVLIDTKRVEFSMYKGLPHLIDGKIIEECEDAFNMFDKLTAEIQRRQELFSEAGAKDISEYNEKNKQDPLPVISVMIDDYSEFLVYKQKAEYYFKRLLYKASESGIYLMTATLRHDLSPDFVSSFETKILFRVSFRQQCKIYDISGAEELDYCGDMLIKTRGETKNLQVPYVSVEEMIQVSEYVKDNFNNKRQGKNILSKIEKE